MWASFSQDAEAGNGQDMTNPSQAVIQTSCCWAPFPVTCSMGVGGHHQGPERGAPVPMWCPCPYPSRDLSPSPPCTRASLAQSCEKHRLISLNRSVLPKTPFDGLIILGSLVFVTQGACLVFLRLKASLQPGLAGEDDVISHYTLLPKTSS